MAVDVAKAIALVDDESSIRYVTHVTIIYKVESLRHTQQYTRTLRSGRRVITAHGDRFVLFLMVRNRHTTTLIAKNQLLQVRQVNASRMRRRLEEVGMPAGKPA